MPSLEFCEGPKAKFDQVLFHKLVVSLMVAKSLAFRSGLEWIRSLSSQCLVEQSFLSSKKKKYSRIKNKQKFITRFCIFRQTIAKAKKTAIYK